MDKQYKDINSIIDEILDVLYIFVPTFLLISVSFIFKDEIITQLTQFGSKILQYSF